MKQYYGNIEVKSPKYKKYAAMLENYKNALNQYGCRCISDCYASASPAKYAAEKKILHDMLCRTGQCYTIIGYNRMMFSCAYLFPHPEDGNLILCYETPFHTYYIDAAGL